MADLNGSIWRKSTRSGGGGGNCIEVAVWHKSSRSTGGGGNCVEVAANLPGIVAVRDSKNPDGPMIVLEPTAFAAFTQAVKAGDLDG